MLNLCHSFHFEDCEFETFKTVRINKNKYHASLVYPISTSTEIFVTKNTDVWHGNPVVQQNPKHETYKDVQSYV